MNQELKEALERDYGILVQRLIKTKFGSAECYLADTDKEKRFVKIYQKKHPYDQIAKEIELCMHLQAKGMQVSQYLPNRKGDFINQTDFGIYTVQSYIAGITYEKFRVPAPILLQSAEVLAQIHNHLQEFQGLQQDFTPEWIEKAADVKELTFRVEHIIHAAEQLTPHELREQITEDCKWKLKVATVLPKLKGNFARLTRKNSHGDYNVYQWICDSDQIKAVIDFGSCSNVPAIWELLRSYTYAARECAEGKRLEPDFYCRYLQRYLQRSALQSEDLQYGCCFYFYTLLVSTFGYRQYIEDYMRGSYNPLIEFALWRSRMSRFLYENYERLDACIYERLSRRTKEDGGCD